MEREFVHKPIKFIYKTLWVGHNALIFASPFLLMAFEYSVMSFGAQHINDRLGPLSAVFGALAGFAMLYLMLYLGFSGIEKRYRKTLLRLDDWLVERSFKARNAEKLKSLKTVRGEAREKFTRLAQLKNRCTELADQIKKAWPADYRAHACPDLPNANFRALRQRIKLWNLAPPVATTLSAYCDEREQLDETEARLEKLATARREILMRLPTDEQLAVRDRTDSELEGVYRGIQGMS